MITIDFETRSRIDLKRCGTSVYARSETTSILCLAYSIDSKTVKLWIPGDAPPQDLLDAIAEGRLVEAHNVFFERNIWTHICHERYGWPDVPFDSWRCTLAACSRLALPRSLGEAGAALSLDVQKDEDGHKIMMRLCKPKPPSAKDPSEWDDCPVKLKRLYKYCKHDVSSEIALSQCLPPLSDMELQVWQLDQKINLRGLKVDRAAVENAIKIAHDTSAACNAALFMLSHGEVVSASRVKVLKDWINAQLETPMPDLSIESVDTWLKMEIPTPVREALILRKTSSMSSTAKLEAMLSRCDDDSRVRGNLVYHGAATGRWAGTGIQIQNFPRGTLSSSEIDLVHRLLPSGDSDAIDMIIGPPIDTMKSCLRSMICADEGKRLLVSDFASIEARVLAWIAGETELLTTFFENQDPYKSMAAKIFNVSIEEVTKPQRQIGKTAILGLGYGMGHKAFRDACKAMAGVTIDNKFAKSVVKTYRNANPNIKKLWSELNIACIRAIETRQPYRVGLLEICCNDDWLNIKLPSSRVLHYREPSLMKVRAPWSEGYFGSIHGEENLTELLEDIGIELGERRGEHWIDCHVPTAAYKKLRAATRRSLVAKDPEYIKQICYFSQNSVTRKWEKTRTYGGKLTENVIQAVARDFLAEAMLRIEDAGYPIVATVHDEILSELEEDEGSLHEFESLMREVPAWGVGCPIEVEGFEARRYRK
jgi:DNA polymerase